MTNREAIFLLKTFQKEHTGEWDIEAFDMAIAALEKQEPVRPEKIQPCNNGLRFGWCPKCGFSQVCETASYCKTCGQRLNWTEDAE